VRVLLRSHLAVSLGGVQLEVDDDGLLGFDLLLRVVIDCCGGVGSSHNSSNWVRLAVVRKKRLVDCCRTNADLCLCPPGATTSTSGQLLTFCIAWRSSRAKRPSLCTTLA
jgi:hypothetical protein